MKKSKPKCDRWKPVRRGDVYCSPACGYDCKHEAFLLAHLNAERLARRCGPDWKPHVWENLGWHYAATSAGNFIKVHPSKALVGRPHYTVFFGAPEGSGGEYTTQGPNLKAAIAGGLAIARDQYWKALGLLQAIEAAAK